MSVHEAGTERTPVTIFEYQRAESWADAVELLGLWQDEAKILAGGQSLIPMLNMRLTFPGALIDVGGVPASPPRLEGGHVVIDANTTYRTVATSPVVQEHAPLLAHAVQFIGNVRVRNRGTVGGSLAHADPTGEVPAVVLALGGEVVVLGPRGERTIPAEEFFVTYLTTTIEPDEVVVRVRIPSARDAGWGFHEVVRRFSDWATVSVSALVRGRGDDRELRLVLGSVADRPLLVDPELLAPALESPGDVRRAGEVADAIAASLRPNSDLHATADYRRRLVAVHTRRLIQQLLADQKDSA